MTEQCKGMMRRRYGLIAALVGIGLATTVPAFAQTDDEEPSRRRTSITPEYQPEPVLPLSAAEEALPKETSQPLMPSPLESSPREIARPAPEPTTSFPVPPEGLPPDVVPPVGATPVELPPLFSLQPSEAPPTETAGPLSPLPDAAVAPGLQPVELSEPSTSPQSPTVIKPLSGVAEAHASLEAGDVKLAYFQFKSQALNGNSEAAYMLGRMNHQGIAVGRNLKSAFVWYMKAARANHPAAQAGVGFFYYRGLGVVQQDYARAAGWFEKAAQGGVSGAMARLAYIYENGQGVQRDTGAAGKWLVLAARLGNRAARKRMRELGIGSAATMTGVPDEIESGLGELPALSTVTSEFLKVRR